MRFWKITVQNILDTEGEEAYEKAVERCSWAVCGGYSLS